MTTRRRRRIHLSERLLFALVLASGPAIASVQPVTVPLHAHANKFGRSECDRGYRKNGASCARLALPTNSHLDDSGAAWDCDSGYERNVASCIARTN